MTHPAFIVSQVASVGAQVVYDHEQIDNVELGIEGSFLDGRARASLNLYHGDYIYRGSYFVDNANVAETGDQEMVNVRLGLRDDRLQFELFARKLLDDQSPGATYAAADTINFAGGSDNSLRVALPDRRRFGVRVSVDF